MERRVPRVPKPSSAPNEYEKAKTNEWASAGLDRRHYCPLGWEVKAGKREENAWRSSFLVEFAEVSMQSNDRACSLRHTGRRIITVCHSPSSHQSHTIIATHEHLDIPLPSSQVYQIQSNISRRLPQVGSLHQGFRRAKGFAKLTGVMPNSALTLWNSDFVEQYTFASSTHIRDFITLFVLTTCIKRILVSGAPWGAPFVITHRHGTKPFLWKHVIIVLFPSCTRPDE